VPEPNLTDNSDEEDEDEETNPFEDSKVLKAIETVVEKCAP